VLQTAHQAYRLVFRLSLVNPQQMLPGAKVTFESQALRDLEACDDLAFDFLVALVRALAYKPILLSRLVRGAQRTCLSLESSSAINLQASLSWL
jgi:hypothetical protein